MNPRILQIAHKFETQIKEQGKTEENLEGAVCQLPAEDVHYMLRILLNPENWSTAKEIIEKSEMKWGDNDFEWPEPSL